MAILVIAEHDHGTLKVATRNTVAAAKKIGGEIHVLVAGHNAGAAAQAAAQIEGWRRCCTPTRRSWVIPCRECIRAGGFDCEELLAHPRARDFERQGCNAAHRGPARRAADFEIIAVESADFVRPIYAGNALATVQSKDAIRSSPVRITGFDAVAATGG